MCNDMSCDRNSLYFSQQFSSDNKFESGLSTRLNFPFFYFFIYFFFFQMKIMNCLQMVNRLDFHLDQKN